MADAETEGSLSASGAAGVRVFSPGDPAYDELLWSARHGIAGHTYDLVPGVPQRLDRQVTRLIAPNPGVMTGPGTNTYLVGERELAVIDPGPDDPAHVAAIVAAAQGRIRWILCTHTHFDHAPAAAALQRATGASIAGQPAPLTRHDASVKLDRVLSHGDAVSVGTTLQAVATPGHASNHLCYLLPETGMLFTGDHIMQGSTVVILPPDGDMRAYLQSLVRLLDLPLHVLAPGHGYLMGQPHAVARRLIQHRLTREGKVRRALQKTDGAVSLAALLLEVYDDVPSTLHPLAARSLQAHLDKLVGDGEVRHAGGSYVRTSATGG